MNRRPTNHVPDPTIDTALSALQTAIYIAGGELLSIKICHPRGAATPAKWEGAFGTIDVERIQNREDLMDYIHSWLSDSLCPTSTARIK